MTRSGEKSRVLIVDDQPINIDALSEILEENYTVQVATRGVNALEIASGSYPPDLILLDIVMPEMDGYEVCRQLKADESTQGIPVIFITAMTQTEGEIKGFELGAVDYITKPISPPILRARVATQLKLRKAMQELQHLHSQALDSNPMTGLPGNNSVAKRIKTAISQKEAECVIYSDLDNFKAFNDKYGFAQGDEVLLFTSRVFTDVVRALKMREAFIGHIGGDDFVVIVPSNQAHETAEEIMNRFDEGILKFYSPKDAAAKCIHSVDRRGEKRVFPLMSISLAGVDLSRQIYKQYIEVNDACAGTKKMAKAMPGSSFFMDRRGT